MQEILIKVPDNFTLEQCAFIKESALLQVEAEIQKELKIPNDLIRANDEKIEAMRASQTTKTML